MRVTIVAAGATHHCTTGWGILAVNDAHPADGPFVIPTDEATCAFLNQNGVFSAMGADPVLKEIMDE